MDITPPDRGRRRGRRLRRHFAGAGRLAVHDVVLLDPGETCGPSDLMPHQHEDQWPDTTIFRGNIGDRGLADNCFPDVQGPMEFKPRARPHTARQRDGRQEAAALGMSIGSEFRLAHGRQEVKPVPKWRRLVAPPRLRVIAIKRGGERRDRDRRDHILCDFLAADPRAQMVDDYRHAFSLRSAGIAATEMMSKLTPQTPVTASSWRTLSDIVHTYPTRFQGKPVRTCPRAPLHRCPEDCEQENLRPVARARSSARAAQGSSLSPIIFHVLSDYIHPLLHLRGAAMTRSWLAPDVQQSIFHPAAVPIKSPPRPNGDHADDR